MPDYPMMLYRDGSGDPWDGRPTDRRVVEDDDDHLSASEDGWQTAVEYWASQSDEPKRRGRPPKAEK